MPDKNMNQRLYVFSIPPGKDFAEIKSGLEAHARVREAPPKSVDRTFYDTFDWRIYGGGGALEERVTNGARTLTWRGASGEAADSLKVTETPRFAWDLPPGRLRQRLEPVLEMRALMPQVTVRSATRTLNLLNGDGKSVVRAELEDNEIRAENGAESAAVGKRLVIVPVRGYQKHLIRAIKIIQEECGLTPAGDNLVPSALEAVGKRAGGYSAKLNVPLEPHIPAGEAMGKLLAHLLHTMEVNEPGLHGDVDSEFLHDFRVAVRRTRSALGQVKGTLPRDVLEKFQPEFAWLGAVTGPTRDLDVYLLKFDDYRASLPTAMRAALGPLHEFLRRHKQKEHRILSDALKSPRYRALADGWRGFLEAPMQSDPSAPDGKRPVLRVANERIWRAYHRVIKKGAKIAPDAPAEALHQLRIASKKLRYLMEFFHTLYPQSEIRALIKALKGIQDNLGDFNDLAVQVISLQEFGRQMVDENHVPVETLMSMGVLVAHLQERQQCVRQEFAERFASFAMEKNRALFQELFHKEPASKKR